MSPEPLSEDHVQTVLASSFLASLDTAVAAELTAKMYVEDVAAAETLYSTGDKGDRLYVVLEGRMQVFQSDDYDRTRMLEVLGPGEVVGELSMFDDAPRSASVSALTAAKLAVLEYTDVEQTLLAHPRSTLRLLAQMSRRLRRANEAITDAALLDVKSRVLKAVIELAARFGAPDTHGIYVDHGLSQEDLARYVGASREMVNRALSDLQLRGVLIVKPRALVLRRVHRR
ncbi:Crp/Fnr family transcriptional regulator [Mycolicibacterium sp.]|uniref:Crp/Fnr family transcriptional regulator n=1 Tax=Mycolicibacterium sp. TaxID=2320850 RepID=UPI003D095D5F